MTEVKHDDSNVIDLKDLNLSLLAIEDKIIILIDGWKSGYECKTCNSTGKVLSGLVEGATRDCPDCKGKGTLLHVPDNAKRLPSTGIIVSMGPRCNSQQLIEMIKKYKDDPKEEDYIKGVEKELEAEAMRVGARVVFNPHVGSYLPLKGDVLIKIMRVHEPLCIVFGTKFDEKQFIDFQSDVV